MHNFISIFLELDHIIWVLIKDRYIAFFQIQLQFWPYFELLPEQIKPRNSAQFHFLQAIFLEVRLQKCLVQITLALDHPHLILLPSTIIIMVFAQKRALWASN